MSFRKLTTLALLASASCAFTQRNPTALRQSLDASAPAWLKQNDVPSVAVAYIDHGKIAWTAVYGEQSPSVPATDKTLYNIASLTKPITAEIVLRLAAKGKLSLDESMSDYWVDPDIKDNPWTPLLTPRIALSHQTGFANWRRMTNGVLTIRWQPGTQTGYSGEGYNYLGRFLEKKTGTPFEQLAQQYVLDPIGMKDTSFMPKPWFEGRIALPHGPEGTLPEYKQTKWSAADLVHTTVGDYARFVIAVMHDQALTKTLVTERSTITRDQVTPEQLSKICAADPDPKHCTVSVGMGLGWQVDHFDDVTILEHGGSDTGAHTFAFFAPQTQTGVVIFTNGENGPKVISEVVRLLYPNPLFLQTIH
jgi:CubicO group peptidase (beta-lactamase class C family)